MKIVLLPGLDGTGKLFEPFVASLTQEMTPAICSYPNNPKMKYRDFLEFASALCPGNEPYLVLGESFSGPIAIEIAAAKPAMLKGVILVNTFATCPRRRVVRFLRKIPTRLLTNPPSMLLTYLFLRHENDVQPREPVSSVLRSLSGHLVRSRLSILESVDVRTAASSISIPICLLQSAHDLAVPKKSRKDLLASLPDPKVHYLRGNHFGLQSYPKAAAQIISEFHRHLNTQ